MCVLFVEDEPLISMIAAEVLIDAGHEVLTAASGSQAVAYIEDMPGRFCCLVTDFSMPGELSGTDVINWARLRYPDLPMVLASSFAGIISRPWLTSQRVTLVSKPYSPSALVKLVRDLTEH